ncbi:hypothetical protein [Cellulomonas xiejunii]|uniref:Uncharacterized protein n=1 Tax=Cellulomonas xiejunii TaxID=2968083 RepID=A0ABY5KSZ1_9CELL|nr:hypothetical protein [Cellulomonas xiejunii]MCC2314243.1 hypothetical protein [Cellulomonas xiejunii]MCC2319606.1 hypothetical protein [Cellulomonas xiejunii]UUI71453.1 hypothetical protein NP048_16920 [Cellulomonas xiejunii]
MSQSVEIAVPNSLILLMDPDTGEMPTSLGRRSVAASSTCVAIGTLNEFDGKTTVHLDEPSELPRRENLMLRWEGTVGTSGRMGLVNVYNEILLEMPANEAATVAVWTNDADEPDEIWVLVS